MKRLLAVCVLCTGLLGLAGCEQTASEPAAQTPTTDSADRQEVMKPALDESTEKPADDAAADDATADDGATEESKP